MSSQNNLTKSRHVSNINLKTFGSILPWPTCVPPTYLLYLLPRPSRQVPEVPYCTVKHLYCSSAIFLHYDIACACLKGIFFHHMSLVYLLPLPSQQPFKYCIVRTYRQAHTKGILIHATCGISTNQAVTEASYSMYHKSCYKGWTPHQTNIAPTAHAASHSGQFHW